MAKVDPIVRVELDPRRPVPEICAVISAMMPYNAGHEEAILRGVGEAIAEQLAKIKPKEGEQVD